MISIIICSRKPDIPASLRDNIETTIGVPYECVVIDNSRNEYSIFSAYNKGVSLSRYPFLLFMHDDISYLTSGWGEQLIRAFADPAVGAAGIAGTPFLSQLPGGWWSTGLGYLYLRQPDAQGKMSLHDYSCKLSVSRETVCLDGVWFCIRKEIFNQVKFDESYFEGFHFYDIDITLQVYQKGYKLLSLNSILIEHASTGVLDEKWVLQAKKFNAKWKEALPVSCIPVPASEQCLATYRVLNEFTWEQLRIHANDKKKIRQIHLDAFKSLLSYRKGYWFFRMPVWILRFFFRYLRACI